MEFSTRSGTLPTPREREAMLSRLSQRDGITLHTTDMSHLRVIRMYKPFQSNLVIEIRRSASSMKHGSLASASRDKLRREYERASRLCKFIRNRLLPPPIAANLCKRSDTLEPTRSRAGTFVHVARPTTF